MSAEYDPDIQFSLSMQVDGVTPMAFSVQNNETDYGLDFSFMFKQPQGSVAGWSYYVGPLESMDLMNGMSWLRNERNAGKGWAIRVRVVRSEDTDQEVYYAVYPGPSENDVYPSNGGPSYQSLIPQIEEEISWESHSGIEEWGLPAPYDGEKRSIEDDLSWSPAEGNWAEPTTGWRRGTYNGVPYWDREGPPYPNAGYDRRTTTKAKFSRTVEIANDSDFARKYAVRVDFGVWDVPTQEFIFDLGPNDKKTIEFVDYRAPFVVSAWARNTSGNGGNTEIIQDVEGFESVNGAQPFPVGRWVSGQSWVTEYEDGNYNHDAGEIPEVENETQSSYVANQNMNLQTTPSGSSVESTARALADINAALRGAPVQTTPTPGGAGDAGSVLQGQAYGVIGRIQGLGSGNGSWSITLPLSTLHPSLSNVVIDWKNDPNLAPRVSFVRAVFVGILYLLGLWFSIREIGKITD